MRWTREEWEKTDGVQAHHVIQSFNPEDNITAREANELGRQLAEEIAKGHEVAIYTHADKEHIHNHIVINSVSFEDGHKYHSDREQLYHIREKSDELCHEKGLDIIHEPYAKERFSQAEYKLVERGERLWKDELRTAIDQAKQQTKSLDEMKSYLKERYNIEMKIQNKNVSFLHPDKERYVRGKTLGESYTKGAIEHEHGRQRAGTTPNHPSLGTDRILFGGNSGPSGHDPQLSRGTDRQTEQSIKRNHGQLKEQQHDHQRIENGPERSSTRNDQPQKGHGESNKHTREGVTESDTRGSATQNRPHQRTSAATHTREGTAQSQAVQSGHNRGIEHTRGLSDLLGAESHHKTLDAFEAFRQLGQEQTKQQQNIKKHQPKRQQTRYKSRIQQQRQGPDLER